jgi:hypothetical protein
MTSKREQVLDRLAVNLKTLETASLKVYRNLDKPQKIPSGGIVILRDGSGEEPEVLLSPLTYIYEHLVTAEIMVQNPDPTIRNTTIDALLVGISSVINANRTLDGLAEWIEARSPEFQEEPIEGAASVRTATVLIMVRFFTSDPLN